MPSRIRSSSLSPFFVRSYSISSHASPPFPLDPPLSLPPFRPSTFSTPLGSRVLFFIYYFSPPFDTLPGRVAGFLQSFRAFLVFFPLPWYLLFVFFFFEFFLLLGSPLFLDPLGIRDSWKSSFVGPRFFSFFNLAFSLVHTVCPTRPPIFTLTFRSLFDFFGHPLSSPFFLFPPSVSSFFRCPLLSPRIFFLPSPWEPLLEDF